MKRAAILLFFVGPLFWQLLTSLWPEAELTSALPHSLTMANYAGLGVPFARAVANSFLVAAATTVLCLAAGASAAFAIAKLEFRGRSLLLGGALAISMFPPIATVSPLYLGLRAIGLRDTLAGLVLPYAAFALPLTLWLLTSFFREVPDEIFNAALVDGCTPWQVFLRVYLPLSWPALATCAILVFIFCWNELLFALSFISTPERRTVPAAIALFAGEHVEPWGQIAAASVVAIVPLAALTFAFQKRIVAGLTAGAVKG
ncbi:MAG: carbohydrate ABC transporter permease [Myxococcales bacterium]|nr:carbohydrate ABC transporter permease [Myxococcales bacterium]